VDLRHEVERLARRQSIEERQILGDHANAALDGDGIRERIDAENPHRALRRAQQTGQALDRRALSRAIRPQEAVEASRRHGKVDRIHRAEIPELSGEPVRLDGEIHVRDSI
jgi:hypothetical protein